MNNYLHIESCIRRRDRDFNNLMPGDKVLVTIKGSTHSTSSYTEMEIEPLSIVRLEERTIDLSSFDELIYTVGK
jgi:hypothetical protein